MKIILVLIMLFFLIGCSNVEHSISKNEIILSEDSIPYTYPLIVNGNDSIIIDQDFFIKVTTNNNYILKLAKQNNKNDYLTAEYAFSFDSTKIMKEYKLENKAEVKEDTV